jgi:peptide/nickel transport system substrate-binding protein
LSKPARPRSGRDHGLSTFERAKRQQIYWKIEEIIRHDLPRLPLFQYVRIEGTKKGLIGYQASVYVAINTWNVKDWYWASS